MNGSHVLILPPLEAEARRRLVGALKKSGGPYQVLEDPAAIFRSVRSEGIESKDRGGFLRREKEKGWISFGLPEAYFGSQVQEWVMNAEGGGISRSLEKIEARLVASGIEAASLRGGSGQLAKGFQRRYLVQVYHLQALQAVPLSGGSLRTGMPIPQDAAGPSPDSPLWRRLSKTAIRALYALGLDYGEVVIRAGEDGQTIVERLSTGADWRAPGWEKRMAIAMREQLEKLYSWQKEAPSRLIGMDPEFLLFDPDSRKVIPASRYLARQGIAGCDVLRYRGQRRFPLAELRPEPGAEPREVVVHLLEAFRVARTAISDSRLIWQAGAMPQRGFPLGGHLHFSGVPLCAELLRALDNYLALPVALLEDERSSRRRPRYGFLGDYRLQDYGGFEYRTLPSFLVSPLATKGIVALASVIAEDFRQLRQRPLDRDEVFHAFYTGNKEVLAQQWPPLASELMKLPAYERYQTYIKPLFDYIASGMTWDESADIRVFWKMQMDS